MVAAGSPQAREIMMCLTQMAAHVVIVPVVSKLLLISSRRAGSSQVHGMMPRGSGAV